MKDATSSLQDLAALCANAEEVTSPGSPLAHGAGINNPAGALRVSCMPYLVSGLPAV